MQMRPARERVLYSFGSFNGDGIHPNAALLPAVQGFFGVTRDGGANGRGTVFQLTPPTSGGDWTETVLYSFTGSGDAAFPSSDLVMDREGNLYGTTLVGGVNDLGAVYQLSPPATEGGTWTETVIFSFSGSDRDSALWWIAVRPKRPPLRNHKWRRRPSGRHCISAYAASPTRYLMD